jgi:DNA (cytosine-5)-methyltransferase 1
MTTVRTEPLTWRSRLSRLLDVRPPLLAGGPPCQGWSSLGKRGAGVQRDLNNAGVEVFLRQVRLLEPQVVLFENVRGFAIAECGSRLSGFLDRLDELGYYAVSSLVRACEYGVPQLRHRLFVFAVSKSLGIRPELAPAPPMVRVPTVADAIADLPRLKAGGSSDRYATAPSTDLQRALRADCQTLSLHEAPAHAATLLELIRALPLEGGSRSDLPVDLMPRSGFHNTYGRLSSNAPAPAVTSSIGRVSSGRHVHPRQDRALTPREAARLQTFRDAYHWRGKRWSIYRQIGNAVPPFLAASIAAPAVAILSGTSTGTPTANALAA